MTLPLDPRWRALLDASSPAKPTPPARALDGTTLGMTRIPTPAGPVDYRVLTLHLEEPAPRPQTLWAQALGYGHKGARVFLDVEATGRRVTTATYAFLVGLLVWEPQAPARLHQWLLPHPAAEPGLWAQVAATWPTTGLVITYNGTRYDLPLVQTRTRLGNLPGPWDAARHVDLLPWVRRVFRAAWPNHRLSTAAARLLGQERPANDVPAAALPDLYHHALLTGDATPLAPALAHNAADLTALARVWAALAMELARLPRASRYPAETWAARARLYHQYQDPDRSLRAWQRAFRRAHTPEMHAKTGLAWAQALRQRGDLLQAIEVWETLAAEGVWEAYEQRIRAALRDQQDPNLARVWLTRALTHLAAATTSPLERTLWRPRFQAWERRLGVRGHGPA